MITISGSKLVRQPAWDDTMVPALSVKTGAAAPTLGAFGPSGSIQTYLFQPSSQNDQCWFGIQMPHDWQEGTNIRPHVHWAPTTTGSGAVMWGLEYTFANINAVFPAPTTIYCTGSAAGVAWTHQITGFTDEISGSGKTLSCVMMCRLFRNATHGDDTYAANCAMIGFDCHYIKNSLGSTQELVK
jgi:hypothetical protein